ncbi:MAG: LysR family transcriptional regulator [Eubacteriales bacterium]|nr:LysR family transcriptional regulator [Eubacteriales bacterium]
MYNQSLNTFIEVADCGSFLKASEKLYISPTAIMKQMNLLEQHIGLSLLIRTNQGIRLTEAGKSLYKDAKVIIQYSKESIDRAYKAQKNKHSVVRVGTSVLYPCSILMELWNSISDENPHFKLKVIPFEDTSTELAFANIGKRYDVIVGPHNSVNTAKFSNFLELGQYHFCIAMPKQHPLSVKQSISYDDLHGEHLLMQVPGNSPVNDKVREDIEKRHPQIAIVDVPKHYDLDVFNRCAEEGCVMLSLDAWKEVHPSLVTIPFQVDYTIPYGILSALKPTPETNRFLDIIRSSIVFNKKADI